MAFLIFYLVFTGSVMAGYIYSLEESDGLSFRMFIFAFLTGWVLFPFTLGTLLYELIEIIKQRYK